MKLTQIPKRIESHIPEPVADFPWTRAVAAGSLVASAYLLFAGRRKAALAVAAAGTAVAVLENPEAVRGMERAGFQPSPALALQDKTPGTYPGSPVQSE